MTAQHFKQGIRRNPSSLGDKRAAAPALCKLPSNPFPQPLYHFLNLGYDGEKMKNGGQKGVLGEEGYWWWHKNIYFLPLLPEGAQDQLNAHPAALCVQSCSGRQKPWCLRTEQALHCSLSINQFVSFYVGSMSSSALWLQRIQTD